MDSPSRTSRFLPILLLLFAGSGCAALIYEVAWYQILQLALGSTAVSLGVLLATFMGGLCIGSIGLPRLLLEGRHPLRVYAAIETGIAIFGVVVTLAMPFINRVYIVGAEHGMPGMLLRGLVAAVAMLPSTILMGASFPAIVRWTEATPRGESWWALLYGSNTAGAVFGCLLAGFYLLRLYDMAIAAYAAAAINLAVAVVSYFVAGAGTRDVSRVSSPATEARLSPDTGHLWTVYVSTAISGACALGAEVIWTRLMAMLLLATVYAFSIILAVFLVGLAIGGAAASWLIRRVRPRLALGWSQLLLILGIVWTAWMITSVLPYWTDALLTTTDPRQMFLLDLKRCVWAILPPSLLWGASFPLACAAAVTSPGDDPGRVAGGVYAANTLGAIVGALAVSLVLIPWIGTQQSTRVILVLSALSGILVLAPLAKKSTQRIGLAAAVAVAALIAWAVPQTPGDLIAYGRRMAQNTNQSQILLAIEGRNSSVAISRWNNNDALYVNVNGHVEATTEIFDMKLQRMVGHLPGLLHPAPKSVLGIGFGAGVSAGTFTRYPGLQKITICEIEPVIPPASTRYFAEQDYDVLHNTRTHMVYDDARHYLLTTGEKFDIIASDPLDVFVKGTAALYSIEYFESVKSHLNPGGYFSLYVPLYETDERTIKSELETFFQAFPNATVWANTRDGLGYDMVFLAQAEPLKINLDEVQQRLDRPGYKPVRDSLADVGIGSTLDLFSTYAGQRSDVGQWTKGAQINRDANLRLSYLAGWGINSSLEDYLYRQMLKYRREPDNIFAGTAARVHTLYAAMVQGAGSQ